MKLRHLLQRRFYSSYPAPPQKAITNLTPTRSLLHIHGLDATKFLQGITTRDIPLLPPQQPSYTAFLNAHGRVLFDTFIYPVNASPKWRESLPATAKETPEEPAYIIEVDAAELANLETHLRRYRLRAKLSIRTAEEWTPWVSWGDISLPSDAEVGGADPRVAGFGSRFLLPSETRPAVDAEEASAEQYKIRRILWGLPEGQGEILGAAAFPGESNFDVLNGVDWRKGCYVGQELTIRTRHRGVVRKRLLPAVLYKPDEPAPGELRFDPSWESKLTPPKAVNISAVGGRRKRPAGKWMGGVGNIGFAKCRLEQMTPIRLAQCEEEGEGEGLKMWEVGDEFEIPWKPHEGDKIVVKAKAFVPEWMEALPEVGGVGGQVEGEDDK
ncbi:transcription factor, component of CCR4 transcriptional complex [Sphaerosporella brunnea]|uniref:Iron-sulfur cluster assembly factor IBA57 homolog, mitochondrial n=1 Tax=Sphaerosporella brunnea TaxID=1250544 RepID=A0A5J5ESY4_9PEZI|nr:transcription factor, component of CCR4 transcriptional complex [Sphaerosporella brunnea]